jgi:hypothetical protein
MLLRFIHLAFTVVPAELASPATHESSPTIRVVERSRELIVEYGPIKLTALVGHAEPPAILFQVPADGWVRGYDVELVDSRGRALPRALLHHVNFIATNRRDLFNNVMLRLGAAGVETRAITLPRLLGVRVQRGDTVAVALMLHNPTPTSYEDVWMRARIPFIPASSRIGALSVYPLSMAIGPKDQPNTFDLPPGRSEHYREGSPAVPARILGLSGHLHRYGLALRLEDRTAGKVIWEIRPRSDRTGEVHAVPVSMFLWTLGKPIRPGHVYRLTAIYDNPEGRTIPAGGMGVIGGIVLLPRGVGWPAVDQNHPDFVADVDAILGDGSAPHAATASEAESNEGHHHSHGRRALP